MWVDTQEETASSVSVFVCFNAFFLFIFQGLFISFASSLFRLFVLLLSVPLCLLSGSWRLFVSLLAAVVLLLLLQLSVHLNL